MNLETRALGDWQVVRPDVDRLDAYIADEFKSQLMQLAEDGATKIILDFASVEFMDSSGLGAIVFVLQRLGAGGKIAIAGAQETVALMLKLTHMNRVFLMLETPEEVLATTT